MRERKQKEKVEGNKNQRTIEIDLKSINFFIYFFKFI